MTPAQIVLPLALVVLAATGAASTPEPPAERGAAVYAAHCASCHGADLKGVTGTHAPDLTDDYWLFGGDDLDSFKVHPADVQAVVRHGLRTGRDGARTASDMPGWAAIVAKSEGLAPGDADDLTEYVLHISGQPSDETAALRGKRLFNGKGTCFDCHASDAKGDSSIGAPDLTRPAVWIYGRDRAAIRASIVEGRAAAMPAFAEVLSEEDIAAVSLYVHGKAAGHDF